MRVTDYGSPDRTGDAVDEMRERYPKVRAIRRQGDRGYGKAVVDGILTDTIPEMLTTAPLQFPEERERGRAALALRTLYESYMILIDAIRLRAMAT